MAKMLDYIYIVCEPLSDGKVRPLQSFTNFEAAMSFMDYLMRKYDKEPQLEYILVRQKVSVKVEYGAGPNSTIKLSDEE